MTLAASSNALRLFELLNTISHDREHVQQKKKYYSIQYESEQACFEI